MAFRIPYLLVMLFFSVSGFSQRERIHLDLDKYSCRAGDTVYFKATVFNGAYPLSKSTNLYIQLYTDRGGLLERSVFPIVFSQGVGQVIFPESLPTANYYLVAFTRQQLAYDTADFFTVPVLVYNPAKPARVRRQRRVLPPDSCTGDRIKGVSWLTTPYKGDLSSLLEIDSGARPRHLLLLNPVTKDSGAIAAIHLDSGHLSIYSLFRVHPERDNEVLCLYEDSVLIGKQVIRLKADPAEVELMTDTLDPSPLGYNSWGLDLPGPNLWYASVDVSDADLSLPSPVPITVLGDSYTDNFTVADPPSDTSFISFAGKATRQSGKRIKDEFARQLVVAGMRDTSYLFMKSVKLEDGGNFNLDSLFFFGTIGLKFQLNGVQDASGKDIKLRLAGYVPSIDAVHSIMATWEDDPTSDRADTAFTKAGQSNDEHKDVKMLKAVVVRGRRNPREELDDTYMTGPFSEPALFYYDLRKDSSDYDRDIFWYINAQNGRLHYDPVGDTLSDVLGHPLHYFVDEQEYPSFAIRAFDFDKVAYIKILESDFLSTKETQFTLQSAGNAPSKPPGLGIPDQKTAINVCIYTRKGKDFRTMRGGMNGMPINGFTKIIPFSSDKITLFWHPMETGHSLRIRFTNSETAKRFRVKVEAMSYRGQVLHYETVISN